MHWLGIAACRPASLCTNARPMSVNLTIDAPGVRRFDGALLTLARPVVHRMVSQREMRRNALRDFFRTICDFFRAVATA